MIKQYNAIGLQCRQFCDVQQNLRHLSNCIDMAFTLASQELPVKLVCLPESAIQGFPMGDPPVTTIPGPETDFFAAKAKALKTYIIGQLLFVKLKGIPDDRLFNCLFIVNDKGEMIYWRAKTQLERIAIRYRVQQQATEPGERCGRPGRANFFGGAGSGRPTYGGNPGDGRQCAIWATEADHPSGPPTAAKVSPPARTVEIIRGLERAPATSW